MTPWTLGYEKDSAATNGGRGERLVPPLHADLTLSLSSSLLLYHTSRGTWRKHDNTSLYTRTLSEMNTLTAVDVNLTLLKYTRCKHARRMYPPPPTTLRSPRGALRVHMRLLSRVVFVYSRRLSALYKSYHVSTLNTMSGYAQPNSVHHHTIQITLITLPGPGRKARASSNTRKRTLYNPPNPLHDSTRLFTPHPSQLHFLTLKLKPVMVRSCCLGTSRVLKICNSALQEGHCEQATEPT
jgi:hypothetical protein